MRYCICGKAILRQKERSRREREYCSDKCRQKAYRERKKKTFDSERFKRKADEFFARSYVPDEFSYLGMLLGEIEEKDRLIASLKLELDELEERYKLELEGWQAGEGEKEAEIARLTTLLESQARKHR
jgi:hypothetical protein